MNPLDYSVWDILQELVYEGHSETVCKLMWTEKALRQNMKQDQWQKMKVYFVVENVPSSSHKKGRGLIQHIFSWTLIKAADY